MTHTWYESYRAAILETDWTKMQDCWQRSVKSAEGSAFSPLTMAERPKKGKPLPMPCTVSRIRKQASDWQERQGPEEGRS
jgi:hypothetical protein